MAQRLTFPPRMLFATVGAVLASVLSIFLSNLCYSETRDASAPKVSDRAEPDRVVEAIDLLKNVTLPGHVPAWASGQSDLGAISPNLKLDHLTLLLSRSAQQEQAFHQLLEDQQDPKSPRFHHWLTPEQIGRQFGLSDHDIEAVAAWLQSEGLTVQGISKSRTMVTFSGTASTVGAALSTEFHVFRTSVLRGYAGAGSGQLISIVSEPKIPVALAAVIKGFAGLAQIPVAAQVRSGVASQAALPQFTNCNSSGTCEHFVTPADFATIFDITPLYQAGKTGTGQKIGIIGRSRVANTDIEEFEQATGIATQDPNVLVPPDGTDPGITNNGDQLEATIDVTRAVGTAPGAGIDLIVSADTATSSGIYIAGLYEVDTVLDPVANISFGACEAEAGAAGVQVWDSLASQAAAEGISIFVSSGDAGAAGCDENNATPPATQTLSPNYICSSSYLTCVGGTEFNDTADPGMYWSSTNGSLLLSALSYIPEGGWNEPTVIGSGGGITYQASSSGGGVSSVIPKPSWQTGTGVPADGFRDTPDVAFPSAAHDAYYACYAANGGDCSKGYFEYFYGTSAAAPAMAAVTALVNQLVGYPQGNLNPVLYRLAAAGSMNVFHDTTIATSGVANCSLSTPSMCNNSTPSPSALAGGLEGYELQTGYDQVTGLGSIDVNNLAEAIAASPLPAATASLTLSSADVTTAQTFTATVQVSGGSPVPTGEVELLLGGAAPAATMELTNGTVVFTGQSITIPGTYIVTSKYLGGSNYQPISSNALTLTVTAAPGSLAPTVTLKASPASITTAQSLSLTATVSGSGPAPTGAVQFSYTTVGNSNSGNLGTPVPVVNGAATTSGQYFLSPGTYQVDSQYSGDANYQGANSLGIIIAVTAPLPPSFTVSAPPLTITAPGATSGNTAVVTVTAQNGFSGTVNLTCGVAFQGSGTANDPPSCTLSNSGSVALTSSATSATLVATIATTAASGSGMVADLRHPGNPRGHSPSTLLGGGVVLAGLLLLPASLRRKSIFGKATAFGVVFCATVLWVGCGGGSSSSPMPPPNPGTTTGAYTVTVSGMSGAATVNTTFTLTLQ